MEGEFIPYYKRGLAMLQMGVGGQNAFISFMVCVWGGGGGGLKNNQADEFSIL